MNDVAQSTKGRGQLVARFSDRFGVDAGKLISTLKQTAFKQRDGSAPVSDEQLMALLVVADQHKLNPFTKEIYAFPDKNNGIVPVVGVDGWARIINEHPQFDGMEYQYSDEMVRPDGAASDCHVWCECVMYRKDRTRPTVVREYLDEVYRAPFKQGMKGPWQTHPKRFLRHKATIQTARLAFSFAGIYDEDEAQRIQESQANHPAPAQPALEQKPELETDKLAAQLPAFRERMRAGERSAEEIISTLETRYSLTDDQRQKIRAESEVADAEFEDAIAQEEAKQ